MPGRVVDFHDHNTRAQDIDLTIPKATATGFQMSYFHSTENLWNDLSQETKQAPSLESFKEKLTKEKVPRPHFNYGNRRAIILQASLRLNCSDLIEDKNPK